MWLKTKRSEGQTAGFGPCFQLPGQPILELRFFEFATAWLLPMPRLQAPCRQGLQQLQDLCPALGRGTRLSSIFPREALGFVLKRSRPGRGPRKSGAELAGTPRKMESVVGRLHGPVFLWGTRWCWGFNGNETAHKYV